MAFAEPTDAAAAAIESTHLLGRVNIICRESLAGMIAAAEVLHKPFRSEGRRSGGPPPDVQYSYSYDGFARSSTTDRRAFGR